MADDISFLCNLPQEILEYVLMSDNIDHLDICNVAKTCIYLNRVVSSNEIWRNLFKKRYPVLFRLLDISPTDNTDWYCCYKCRHGLSRSVREANKQLSPKYFKKIEIPDTGYRNFIILQESCKFGEMFVIDELMCILHESGRMENLTEKYYAAKVLQYLQTRLLKKEWKDFLSLPPTEQSLEKGAVLIANWCQPKNYISDSDICEDLDVMAHEVKAMVKMKHPSHPLNHVDELYTDKGLTADVYSSEQSRQILDCLNHVLYTQLGYYGNEEDYYDIENSFINKVIENKRGIPITMSVIYACIARRLGVICEPVNFPSHFLLRWKEFPELKDAPYSFIDAFRRGKRLSERDLQSLFPQLFFSASNLDTKDFFNSVEPVKVFERMARNLVNVARQRDRVGGDSMNLLRSVVELLCNICPSDLNVLLLLARISIHLGINLSEILERLQSVPRDTNCAMNSQLFGEVNMTMEQLRHRMQTIDEDEDQTSLVTKKRKRRSKVDYSVGLVMRHKRYNYTCVIYGWDERCESSREWIEQMGVHNLPQKDEQPFYNVLVEDGSNRYAAQENLTHSPEPVEVPHPEVGKYFCQFNGCCYIMNEEKQAQYPEDMKLTTETMSVQVTD